MRKYQILSYMIFSVSSVRISGTTANKGTWGSLVKMTLDVVCYSWGSINRSIWRYLNWYLYFWKKTLMLYWIFFLERIIQVQSFSIQSLYPWKKLTQRNERHLVIKLCTCIFTLFFFTLPGLDFLKLPNAFHFVEWGTQQWAIEYQVLSYRYRPSVNKQHAVSTLGSPSLR